MRTLEFAFKESITGIIRNGLMSVASIGTVALALVVLGSFVLLAFGLNHAVESQLAKFEMAAWMTDGATDMQVADLEALIKSVPHVQSVERVSAEATWEKIKQDWKGRVNIEGVRPGSLTAHFRVKLDDPRYTTEAAEAIRKFPRVEEVIEAQQVVEQVVNFADIIKLASWGVGGILFLISAFIVSNTIRLTLYARRREIRIMQLVGATNWFIRLPYVFEGIILGAIGGGIACGLIFGGAHYLNEAVTKIMPLLTQVSSGLDPLQFNGGLVAAGCLIGMSGSLMSIRKFLKA